MKDVISSTGVNRYFFPTVPWKSLWSFVAKMISSEVWQKEREREREHESKSESAREKQRERERDSKSERARARARTRARAIARAREQERESKRETSYINFILTQNVLCTIVSYHLASSILHQLPCLHTHDTSVQSYLSFVSFAMDCWRQGNPPYSEYRWQSDPPSFPYPTPSVYLCVVIRLGAKKFIRRKTVTKKF